MIAAPVPDELERVGIGILATALEVDRAVAQFLSALVSIERKTDVLFETRGYTDADLTTLSAVEEEALSTAVPLLGLPPEFFIHDDRKLRNRLRTHADADRRLLRLSKAIGNRLVQDPTITERAREYIQRYLQNAPPGERKEMEEWAGILDSLSPHRLRRFLIDPGPRATRLRQSLPFVAALPPAEREAILSEANDDEKPA